MTHRRRTRRFQQALQGVSHRGPVPSRLQIEALAPRDLPSVSFLANDAATVRHEVVLVDPTVPEYRRLVETILSSASPTRHIEVAILGPDGVGLEAVDRAARVWGGLDAIHVISHGEPGAIHLGGAKLTSETLPAFRGILQRWGVDLRIGGDLLFYGCNLANSAEGRDLLEKIRVLTGADVAASTDLTGTARLGGDWELEYAAGAIDSESLTASTDWTGLLAVPSGLLISTQSDVNSSTVPGMNFWTTGTVVQFDDPNLTLEPGGTSGSFSAVANLDTFGDGDVKITGLHFVRRQVTVGSGSAIVTLLPGDLVLAANDNEVLTSLNSLSVNKDDIFVFRPATSGDYSSGTFLKLLDKFNKVSGGGEVSSLALVEIDTLVGNKLLRAGTLLFSPKDGSGTNDIRMFVPSWAGPGTTFGTVSLLIEGDQLNYSGKIHGLELIDEVTTIGGRTLAAGTLLVSLESDDASVGTNRIAVKKQDIFALEVTRTSGAGSRAIASASLLFRGSDVGLSGGVLHGIALALTGATSAGNNAPVAVADQYSITEDGVLSVSASGVLANDRDDDGDSITAELTSLPSHGTIAFNADGSFVYTPTVDYSGADEFTYTAMDGRGGRATTTVSLTITSVNDLPTLSPIADLIITEDSGTQVVSLTGITAGGVESQGLSVTAVSSNPSVIPNPQVTYSSPSSNGSLLLQPVANASGTATITVTVRDAGFDGAFGTVDDAVTTQQFNVTLTPVNDPPISMPDGYTRPFSFRFGVSATNGVLANDSDVEGGPLTAVLVADASYGNVTLNSDGSFTYFPYFFFQAYSDSFTYQAVDADGALSPVTTVAINFGVANTRPFASADTYSTPENSVLSGTSVLANDVDADGDGLTAVLVAGPANGALQFNSDGTFTYTPTADYNGPDSFIYRAFDGQAYSTATTVSLSVTGVNNPPVAANDAVTLAEDGSAVILPLANDTDPDGDPMTVVSLSTPAHGTVTTDGTTITYVADPDYHGLDSFQYTVSDGNGGLAVATIDVTITAVNDAPVAEDGDAVTDEDTPASGTLGGVDVDGDPLSYSIVSGPVHGTFTSFDPATGDYTYAPNANYHGPDSFTFLVNDGAGDSNVATVELTVVPVNDSPIATSDVYSVDQDDLLETPRPGVIVNDVDVDGDALSTSLERSTRHGTLKLRENGSFTYTPDAGFSGQDSFRYRVTDGSKKSNIVLVRIEVVAAPEVPPENPDDDVDVAPLPDSTPPPSPSNDGEADEATDDAAENPLSVPPSVNSIGNPGSSISPPLQADDGPGVANAPPVKSPPPIQVQVPPPVALPPMPQIPLPPIVRETSLPTPPILLPPLIAVASALPSILPPAAVDDLIRGLSELDTDVQATSTEGVVVEVAAASGMVMSAGYMLLNPRLALWLFGALAARKAIWKPFDPLDVMYAWEQDEEHKPGKDAEEKSLKSMFGA